MNKIKSLLFIVFSVFSLFVSAQSFNSLQSGGLITISDSTIIHRPGRYYKAALTNYPFISRYRVLNVNTISGVDPTGVTVCHTALQTALDASGYYEIIFDGTYRIQGQLTIPANKKAVLMAGTSVRIYNNVASGSISCFAVSTNSCLQLEQGSELTVETAGTINYIGVQNVASAYGWTICGRGRIHGFGRHGIYLNNAVTPPNQYITGLIKDVKVHNISAVTGSYGDGIKILSGTEFVRMENIEVTGCAGNGVYILGANNPISSSNISGNTLYGVKVTGNVGNSDHFFINSVTFAHNTAGAADIQDVDTGVNFNGCSFYGKANIINSQGVSFNGCGIQVGPYWNVETGASGGNVNIVGGHTISGTQANFLANLTGGGTVAFFNTLEAN